jgi:hypothetical protein
LAVPLIDVLAEEGDVLSTLDAVAGALHASREPVDVDYWAARLASDPRFAAEMALCMRWHMPHSQFLSWPELDREKALAFELHESRRCRECGVHPDDWPEDTGFDEAPPFVVEASRCYGCLALHDFQTEWRKANTHGAEVNERAMKGVRTRFVRTQTET